MIHNKESIPCIIGSTIGMVGSLIFILVYSFIKEIRDPARKYILVLASCDFLLGFSAILPGPSSDRFCEVQGFLLSFSFAASCSFIFLVSLVFYLKFCHDKNVDQSTTFFIFGVFSVVVICLIASIIFVFYGKIGPGFSHWCWTTKPEIEPVIYIITWVSLIGTLILYLIIFLKLRKNRKYSKTFQYKIFALGWIYVFTELWTSIKRARQMANPDVKDNLFLDVIQAIFTPMLGLWDSVFFVFGDKNVRSFLKLKLKKKKYEELKITLLENPNVLEISEKFDEFEDADTDDRF
ncbi:g protein-coupled receptor [Anaeramoeba ignava]|uniref:G protein-coupled receptor n=1 Tax=Anaeramoeba ignava TaxID=1746090 RepID=A0A9Q0RBM8_ANAIG|nr:g protein-coupled receptor [Anaeramoeba ignava]